MKKETKLPSGVKKNYDEALEQEEDVVCDKCGMSKASWTGNDGRGYKKGPKTYCCEGCAEDDVCTCAE